MSRDDQDIRLTEGDMREWTALSDLHTTASTIGVVLRGDEGQPFHCGVRMRVKTGIMGPDYARCECCGAELRNMSSPHVNGGYVVNEAWLTEHGENTWSGLHGKRSMSPCLTDGAGLIVCQPAGTTRPVPKRRRKRWWCFQCRKRLLHTYMMFEPKQPSYYEPNFWWKCPHCHGEHVLFPGREWVHEE